MCDHHSKHPKKVTWAQPIKRTISMKIRAQESIRDKLLRMFPLGTDNQALKNIERVNANVSNVEMNAGVWTPDAPTRLINKMCGSPAGSTTKSTNKHHNLKSRDPTDHGPYSTSIRSKETTFPGTLQYMPTLPFRENCSSSASRTLHTSSFTKQSTETARHTPRISKNIKNLLKCHFTNLIQAEVNNRNSCVCRMGDAEIRSDDIRRLTALPKPGKTDAWLNDELINSATSLGDHLKWTNDVYILNTQTVEAIYRAELELNTPQNKNKFEDRLNRITRRLIKSNRKGQRGTIVDASVIVAPTLVGGIHWVTFVAEKKKRKITLLDSLHSSTAPGSEKIAQALSHFLCMVEEQSRSPVGFPAASYTFEGLLSDYPKQSNGSDCGIFTFLAVHTICSGVQPAVDDESIQAWRRFLAFVILQHATWSGGFTGL